MNKTIKNILISSVVVATFFILTGIAIPYFISTNYIPLIGIIFILTIIVSLTIIIITALIKKMIDSYLMDDGKDKQ